MSSLIEDKQPTQQEFDSGKLILACLTFSEEKRGNIKVVIEQFKQNPIPVKKINGTGKEFQH